MNNDLKDLQVPNFVNDRHYEKEKEEKTIKKLKIYKKTLQLVVIGATFAVVMAKTPSVLQTIHDVSISMIERDNELFNSQKEKQAETVEKITGQTIEEISESGKIR